jgi:hypothetical protein
MNAGVLQNSWFLLVRNYDSNREPVRQVAGRGMAQVDSRGVSLQRPGFAPGLVHVGFVEDKVAKGQDFLRVL